MRGFPGIKKYMKNQRDKIYAIIPSSVFWGQATRERYNFLMKSQWWGYEELLKLQFEKLSRLLDFAYRHVPFYREVFEKLGAVPQDIKTLSDLKSFPIIDKAYVNDHYEEFIPKYTFPQVMNVSTSGSSGQILSFFWHPDYLHIKSAANHRHESWAGKSWTGRGVIMLRPLYDLPDTEIYSIDHKNHTWIFNTADLSDAKLERMVAAINRIRPDTLSGFPSILNIMARYIQDHGQVLKKYPVSIMTVGEIVTDEARKTIEDSFHSRLFDWYGMNEGCATAGQCEFGSYHMNMEYNLIEFVEQDGLSKIVGTNLENLAFPLIRYDTGDMGEFGGYQCPCNRGLPLIRLTGGRIVNLIKTKGGKKYIYFQYFNQILKSNIREFQIVQNSIDAIDLFIVKNDKFTEDDLKKIRSHLMHFLGEEMALNIHFVDNISRGPSGKYQAVISNI